MVGTSPHSQAVLHNGLIVVRRAKWRFVAFVRKSVS
jgi:hypothetical protein